MSIGMITNYLLYLKDIPKGDSNKLVTDPKNHALLTLSNQSYFNKSYQLSSCANKLGNNEKNTKATFYFSFCFFRAFLICKPKPFQVQYFFEKKTLVRKTTGLYTLYLPHHSISISKNGFNIQYTTKDGKLVNNQLLFKSANPDLSLEGISPVPTKVNYFTGSQESDWYYEVPVFDTLMITNLYPNIDLVGYVADGAFEFDFIVHPGGKTSDIKLHVGQNPISHSGKELQIDSLIQITIPKV